MFRVLIVYYSLDVLPEVMAELKACGLATTFAQECDSVKGDWRSIPDERGTLDAMRSIQSQFVVTLRLEVK